MKQRKKSVAAEPVSKPEVAGVGGCCMKHRADSQLYFSSSQPRDEGPRKVRTAGSVK